MTSAQIAADLRAAIAEGGRIFAAADDRRSTLRPPPGGWCAREIVGHLIDSACNHHRRFVLGYSPETTQFDGYNQDEWVAAQHYDAVPWTDLVALWTAYNQHLAHIIAMMPDDVAARTGVAPHGGDIVSVGFLMQDYVRHLRHHLAQIRALVAS